MRLAILIYIMAIGSVSAKPCTGKDLAPDHPLHIAVLEKPTTCPRQSVNGDRLRMHYTGTLYNNCKKFDSSRDRNEPFEFVLGAGEVIKGWDEGLVGMCVGEKRKVTIPSNKGYGSGGAGADIPGGATLQFEVELMGL